MDNKKVYKAVVAVVRIIDPVTEKTELRHIKAMDSKERREWLLKTVMWCIMNKKIIEIVNQEDDKDE